MAMQVPAQKSLPECFFKNIRLNKPTQTGVILAISDDMVAEVMVSEIFQPAISAPKRMPPAIAMMNAFRSI